jgi:hypothetical protein
LFSGANRENKHSEDGERTMKWMIVIGLAAAVIGWLYRWFVSPKDSEKWGLMDVGMTIIAIGGLVFFALGLILFGLNRVFR